MGKGAKFLIKSKNQRTIPFQKIRSFHKMFDNINSSGQLKLQASSSLVAVGQKVLLEVVAVTVGKLLRPLPLLRTL